MTNPKARLEEIKEKIRCGEFSLITASETFDDLLEIIEELEGKLEVAREALDSIVDWESYCIDGKMNAREVLYEACKTANEALKKIGEES